MQNNSLFKVSVIMPVYNAEQYVEEAIKSAIHVDSVGEIILVEDGSKDNSLSICINMEKAYEKVRLLTHENNQNKGASSSRNLGILNAQFSFISFLDADDVYCENRFDASRNVFLSDEKIDGVYSAVGYLNETDGKIFTLSKIIPPEKLFHYLLRGTYGHFHTNGITVKRQLFEEVGYFNPELRLHQDTEMWLRMAFKKVLFYGELNSSVALIRRHEGNRIWKGQNNETRFLAYQSFFDWVIKKNISILNLLILVKKISFFKSKVEKKSFGILFIKKIIGALIIKYATP